MNYKYSLKPTKLQESLLNQQFFVANQVWNFALNLRQQELKKKQGFVSFNKLYELTKIYLKERNIPAHTGIIQQTLRNFENTLKDFFKRKEEKGFPKFKRSSLFEQSFEFKNQGIQITEKYFKILKMKIK